MGGIGADDGNTSGSEGNDEKSGDKGQLNGDPYALVILVVQGLLVVV